MEIVCRSEAYRRFESSSLRHGRAPFTGALFRGAKKRLRNIRIIGDSREPRPQMIAYLLPFFYRRCDALPIYRQYTPSLRHGRD